MIYIYLLMSCIAAYVATNWCVGTPMITNFKMMTRGDRLFCIGFIVLFTLFWVPILIYSIIVITSDVYRWIIK